MRVFNVFKTLLVLLLFGSFITACSNSASNEANTTSVNNGEAKAEQKIDFPNKPIEIVVPFSPGGPNDLAARALVSVVHKYLPNGQSAVIVNKPGGSGAVGLTEVFQAKPDGYKIAMSSAGSLTIVPITSKTAYSPSGFKAIMKAVATPNVLVVQKDAPWKNYDEWFAFVKENPGKFKYATGGTGLTQHITMESISLETGIKVEHVPFQGGAPAVTAILGGHVDGALVQTSDALAHIKEGTLRPIVLTGSYKTEDLKDIPMLTEKNINVATDVWSGLVAPKDTPDEVIRILHDAFKKASEDPEAIEQLKKIGLDPAYSGSEDFMKQMESDYKKNGEVIKTLGIDKK